ncbi:recombinase family protein [Virgibacillus halodenitrificans]|uniref:recombinase family protein n=1 Tax=Virgibacillus halodenitrificans TaxID=1482 RepID=UPI001F236171|nr:recombinase family protein [Virgibacillus halodenitrificans]
MKCAIYIRVSTNKEEQKQSLENQKELFMNLLTEKEWDMYDTYLDVQSGTKMTKRPELKRMIEDAKMGKFDIILAKELSRLARNGQLSYEIKNLAEHRGIHILTLDGAIDTLSGNTQMFGLYAWMYEQESQRTSDRVKAALRIRAKNHFKGSVPPYGYYVQDGVLKIKNDFTPGVVRRIFNSYLSGKGFDRIAKELLEDGISTPSEIAGKRNSSSIWHGSTIRNILENPHYIGNMVQQRETSISVTTEKRKSNDPSNYVISEGSHDPIISKDDFQVVQQLIAERKRKRPYAKKHLFTNISFCADCGKSMHFKANRKGYICGKYNKHGNTQCSSHLVRENVLIEMISEDIKEMFSGLSTKSIQKNIEKKLTTYIRRDQKRLAKILKEIENIKKDKTTALRMKIRAEIQNDEYRLLVEDNSDRITKLNEEKKKLEKGLLQQKQTIDFTKLIQQIEQFVQNPILNEEMLHKLIERIEIKEDGSPRIHYRFSDPYISSIFLRATHSTPHDSSAETYQQAALLSFHTRLHQGS